jgi:hypothetical protein
MMAGLTIQWLQEKEDDEFSMFCFEWGYRGGVHFILVGVFGVIVWFGIGLGLQEEDEDTSHSAK